MGALRAEVEGLAAEIFLLEDLTLARSLIPNLEADLADLADFPAPTQSKNKISSLIDQTISHITYFLQGYLLDIVADAEDTSCESWTVTWKLLTSGLSFLKAKTLSLAAGVNLR